MVFVYMFEEEVPEKLPLKLLIAEQFDLLAQAFKQIMGEFNFELVGTAIDNRDAVETARIVLPDFIALELTHQRADAIDYIPQILEFVPRAHILVFSHYHSAERGFKAIDKGASGFVTIPFDIDYLRNEIKEVLKPIPKFVEYEDDDVFFT